MITLYGTKSHTSSKSAVKWFKEHKIKIKYVSLDKKDDLPIPVRVLEDALERVDEGLEGLVSTKSLVSKAVLSGRDIHTMDKRELFSMLANNYKMLKLPIIVSDKVVLTGYNEDEMGVFVPREHRKANMRRYLEELHKLDDLKLEEKGGLRC